MKDVKSTDPSMVLLLKNYLNKKSKSETKDD